MGESLLKVDAKIGTYGLFQQIFAFISNILRLKQSIGPVRFQHLPNPHRPWALYLPLEKPNEVIFTMMEIENTIHE